FLTTFRAPLVRGHDVRVVLRLARAGEGRHGDDVFEDPQGVGLPLFGGCIERAEKSSSLLHAASLGEIERIREGSLSKPYSPSDESVTSGNPPTRAPRSRAGAGRGGGLSGDHRDRGIHVGAD